MIQIFARKLLSHFAVRVSVRAGLCLVKMEHTSSSVAFRPRVVQIPERFELQHITKEERKVLTEAVEVATSVLHQGCVIAVPTDTIYGIAGLAQSMGAVNRLYDIKSRHCAKPIAISVAEIDDVYRWSNVSVDKEVLTDLLPGPVTVVFQRSEALNPALNPNTHLVGIRIPDHTFMRSLAHACGEPIALTSANRSAAQSTLSLDEFQYLWPQLDLLVDGGILGDTDKARLGSTVVNLSVKGKFQIIREGSAYKRTVDLLKNKHHLEEMSLST